MRFLLVLVALTGAALAAQPAFPSWNSLALEVGHPGSASGFRG